MNRLSSLVFLLFYLFTFLPLQARDYVTVPGDMMNTRIYTLENGLKVYLSVNPEKPRIQTFIAVRTGSKNDPAETTGLAHYLEHLMFKGTQQFGTNNPEAEAPLLAEIEQRYEQYRLLTDSLQRRQAYHEIDSVSQIAAQYFIPNEYDKLMAAIGSQGTNAYTSNDVTCYTENIPSNEIENWARIQGDRFQNMVIRGFHTELEAVYEEYNIGLTSDMRKLYATMCKMLWPNHPYGLQTTIGTQEHLKNPSITNIKNYFKKWYVPNNVAICMAGDLDPDKTIAIIDQYFAGWKPGADVSQPVFAPLPPLNSPRDTTIVGQEAEQVWIGWRAKQANDLQADTLDLMVDVLSNGRAGLFDLDLNQTMKVQRAFGVAELLHDHGGLILVGEPRQGQTLDEVRQLLFGEIEKLKQGDFPDNLLPSIINNKKRAYYQLLESNAGRADMFVDAFIEEKDWRQQVGMIDRISKITKQEIMDFARHFFTDGYCTVYKRQGIDSTQKKIDKPVITPIPTNRDQASQFLKDVQGAKVEPIQPRFVDFEKDLTTGKTRQGLPIYYVENKENGLFSLTFRYEFGHCADNRYEVASDYIDYLGTNMMTASEVKQKFYELACDFNVSVGSETITVGLYGLSENMAPALTLLEELLQQAQPDQEAYNQLVDVILKERDDAKKNQQSNFDRLYDYGVYGPRNASRDMMTAEQLKQTAPQVLTDLLKHLNSYEHSVNYYGPKPLKELEQELGQLHVAPTKLLPVPENKFYEPQPATTDEVLIAPYDAKNIYMRMYHNEQRPWNPAQAAVISVFNTYFGSGMNGVVFQEMREARGLAYNAYAVYQRPGRVGQTERYFTHIITQNDKMMDCIKQFHVILNELPVNEGAFQIAKDGLAKQLASLRTTKMGVINLWHTMRRLGLSTDLNKTIYEALPSVTLEQMADFERQQMANKQYRYMILGDEKELDMEALGKIGPIRRLTTEEIFGY